MGKKGDGTEDQIGADLRKRSLTLGELVGHGTYAQVRMGVRDSGEKVALKIMDKKSAPAEFSKKFLPRELSIIVKIKHEHCIEVYDYFTVGPKVVVIMEFAGHGDLLDYIKLKGKLSESRSKLYTSQINSALSYIHGMNFVHRDLKCENLLLDVKNNIKVTDFGFAREIGENDLSRTYCGSVSYAAPEVIKGTPYRPKIHGRMPYSDKNIKQMVEDQSQGKVPFGDVEISDNCKDIISGILEARIEARLTGEQISRHAWLDTSEDKVAELVHPTGLNETIKIAL